MKTVVKARSDIRKLWGEQIPKPQETYRLIHYALRVEQDGSVALHNNVTGQLVLLDDAEVRLINSLPLQYCSEMDELIAGHFLVPSNYDEPKQVINLRKILKKLAPVSQDITHYTILPTSACNARCYYCFEQGTKFVTMTEKVANDTVKFIADHCGEGKKVSIIWFGGEPTVASTRIDQICLGLQSEGISYTSMMYTNGYLMDEKMTVKAKTLWHLNQVQMSIDGTEQIYNSIKAYVNADESPYRRVLRNIGFMLDNQISVAVRMNIDYVNYLNFTDLMQEFAQRYKGNERLFMCAYPLIGEYTDHDGILNHADESWLSQKVEELNLIARANGFIRPHETLPSLIQNACMGDNRAAITVGPEGNLVKCAERFGNEDTVGTITDGITDFNLVREWEKVNVPEQCLACVYFPNCIKLSKCSAEDSCYRHGKNQQCVWNIQYVLKKFLQKEGNSNEVY